jgi:alkylation response protein AidB-like acyl-CoA dehydrogenase
VTNPADARKILQDFDDALHAAAERLAPLRVHAEDVDAQMTHSAQLLNWLFDGGWVRHGWPEDVGGLGGPPVVRLQILERLTLRGYPIPEHLFALEVVGPAVVSHAPALAATFMPAALRGDELWCQGFSEPEAGSDLAALRTRAVVRDDGDFLVSGQKIWTSYGARADRMVALVRTGPADSRHRGLSMMLIDMDQPGIERRPIALASGREEVAEVFFADVVVPRGRLIGELDGGWGVAMDLLQYERGAYAWMRMATATSHLQQVLDVAKDSAADIGDTDPIAAQAVGRAYLSLAALRARTASTLKRLSANEIVGAQTSVDKLLLSAAEQDVTDAALTLLNIELLLGDEPDDARHRDDWWYSRAATIYGGAREIQHSIIADRILGLPKETTPRGR